MVSKKSPKAFRPPKILSEMAEIREKAEVRKTKTLSRIKKLSVSPVEFFRRVVGFTPTKYQEDLIQLFLKEQFVAARWCRQCVDGETLIFLNNGAVEPIKSLEGSWFTGLQPVFRVVSSSGKELICTEDHKFWTKEGWKKLKGISLGDEVFVQNEIPVFGDLEIADERVKILAYLLTDGSFQTLGQSIKFTGKQPYVTEFVNAINKEFSDIEPKLYRKGHCFDVLCTANRKGRTIILARTEGTRRIASSKVLKNSLRIWLSTLSFIGKIPRLAFHFNRRQLALFINRLYAADGWVSIWKATKNRLGVGKAIEIGFGSPNKQDITALQMLLLKFGVNAKIREEHPSPHSKKKKPVLHVFYRLIINDIYSIKRFFDNIGFIFGKENRSREAHAIVKNRINAIEGGKCPKVTRLAHYSVKKGFGTKSPK